MDPSHFDSLTRALTAARSRRGAFVALLGGTLGLLGLADTEAKKKQQYRHRPTQPRQLWQALPGQHHL